jgi:hypothetical protein
MSFCSFAVAVRFSVRLLLFRYFRMVRRLTPATNGLSMNYDTVSLPDDSAPDDASAFAGV